MLVKNQPNLVGSSMEPKLIGGIASDSSWSIRPVTYPLERPLSLDFWNVPPMLIGLQHYASGRLHG